jgi:SAM-dependent methyltransferase
VRPSTPNETRAGEPDGGFYDRLAPYYHLLYADWEGSILRQGAMLAGLLREHGIGKGSRVIDGACGVGTQTIGLLGEGYRVSASDASPGAVRRAREELARRGLEASVEIADIRSLSATHTQPAPAVIACDNAIPHLLSDDDILRAFRECYRCTAPGGVFVISVRDYAAIDRRTPDVHVYGLRDVGERRFVAMQVWDWRGDLYDFSLYLTEDTGGPECATHVMRSTYYAVSTSRLVDLMCEAGFERSERRDGAFFQPLVIGRRSPPNAERP